MSEMTSRRPDLRLAVVVGVGGMGCAVARRLAQGYRLLLVDIDETRAAAAAADLCSEGAEAEAVACDITDAESVAHAAEAIEGRGGFRVLAHVAGLSPSMGDFASILRVNLFGAAQMEQALRPIAGAGTAAIFISSIAGHGVTVAEPVRSVLRDPLAPNLAERLERALPEGEATPSQAYILSKYALMSLCRRQALAWGERGARILSLSPGLIATPMGALEFQRNPGKSDLLAATPLGREGTMLEIADALEYLASDRASYISGADLCVDGGLTGRRLQD